MRITIKRSCDGWSIYTMQNGDTKPVYTARLTRFPGGELFFVASPDTPYGNTLAAYLASGYDKSTFYALCKAARF